ncbi:hypothetical protein CMV_020309 [Castanea mollissima]|uniref:Malectin-like domain-containing protein n=1 Tax=Castanea mollissima TaxID=60419 RepID=A0A8J4VDR6_9ROSI|nr:hypothetical protein CMV_020309 [Castanea mollissima]
MRNLSVLTPIVSIFCIFFLLYQITLVASSTPPRYVSDDAIITLDCGSATDKSKDMYERDWTGDFQSKFFPKEELNNLKSNTSKAPIEGTVTKAPYSTARISSSQFTYVFPVTFGPKFVRLHFNPVIYPGFERSKAFFTVKAGSFTLLRNFTASIPADSLQEKTFFKEFCINARKDQKLNLTFIPFSTTFYAFINGIEIVPMPDNLYYKPQGISEEGIPYLSGNPFYINDDMALEMVYRLNVAGNLISPTDDTGFFRQWSQDNNYFKSTESAIPHEPSLKPDYSVIPNYTAPDAVYQSARTMGFNRTKNSLSNLTWGLPVDTGFNYLVRLHFCEIDPNMNVVGQRRFIIYIDSLIAEQAADVILWTEKIGTPVYKDYVVNIRKKGDEGSHILSIDLHPITTIHCDDSILNGVEVFKLSNSDGNLAGPSEMLPSFPPVPSAKEVSTKKTIFIAIGGGVGVLVLLTSACFMILWKLRKSRRYGSYHPLSKFWCWRDPYKGKSTRTKASSLPDEVCRHFSLEDIKTATDNFHQELIIANWARKCAENGTIYEIIDPYLKGKIAPECFKVYVEVAENCVRDQGVQRPTMNDVMERLEFALELQQNADAAQEEINPGGDFTYQEVLSFRVSGRTTGAGAPPRINFEPVLESDTNPSLDSESVTVTSREVFTDNSNTTT